MTPPADGVSTSRPVILGTISPPRTFKPTGGGSSRVTFRKEGERLGRIDLRFEETVAAFGGEIQLAESIQAADPQLVLVFEALDEQIDLTAVARRLGLEILVESEGAMEPTDEYQLISKKPRNPFIRSCLHAVCLNETALKNLLSLWRKWKQNQSLGHGYSPLRELFAHLKDVRPWGPQDRLKMLDWDEHFAGRITDQPHAIEIELWYRHSPQKRLASQREVTALVEQAGGQVHTSAVIEQIGYHGLKCTVPTDVLLDLARGNFGSVHLVRSANVMYLRVTGQGLPIAGPPIDAVSGGDSPLPASEPVVCLLDGVPAANHPLLQGRVIVHDPDDLLSNATVDELKHGTWMASAAVWGDLGSNEPAARRPVLVRPILTPSDETADRSEELPATELVPDLMWRVFRELFEGKGTEAPAGSQIAVVNLSVGDPASPFDSILSSWARIIDWLSYEYGVLVIVSVGNHPRLRLTPSNSREIAGLTGEERRQSVLNAQEREQNNRRPLAPAESINALAVGALHNDASGTSPQGYALDPTDGLPSLSPISATGSGYRRSIKPDLVANGGRVIFRVPPVPEEAISFANLSALGPGIRVATPTQNKEAFIAGTSPAAALVTRQAARIHDLVDEITAGRSITRRQRASAIKALLVHGADLPPDLSTQPLARESALGNGIIQRDYTDGCATNEAVVLFVGSIGAAQEQELLFPLPDGLGIREAKRIDATLAWLSPVNWRHRQYRKASLAFVKPAGSIPKLPTPRGLSSDTSTRGAATVQHQSWELTSSFGAGQGSNMVVRVKCLEQAGGLAGEQVDFAVALSLWVAPTVNVDIYNQVKTQIEPRVAVRPR
ncbi:S8 family peptidase [Microbacterium sp. NPDC006705]|uniref:S8 family peptidase n=2 Tax=Actinomycetes TaxID=1760 RepID=UPI001567A9BF|nr:S8 family peptidase [Micrococcus sp. A7]